MPGQAVRYEHYTLYIYFIMHHLSDVLPPPILIYFCPSHSLFLFAMLPVWQRHFLMRHTPLMPTSPPPPSSLPHPGVMHSPHATPGGPRARAALSALLTPPLASRLTERDPRPLLTLLGGSALHEGPTAIWGPAMREEALGVLAGLREVRGSVGGSVGGAGGTEGS